jgi:flavodoxin I
MKTLISYATYSGSTQAASQIVTDELSLLGISPTVKMAAETTEEDIAGNDLIIFASPSWDANGLEGQPHEDFLAMHERFSGKAFEGKQFAVLGLGDSSYTHFCGAVDHLEEYIKEWHGKLAVPSLKIDGFYYKPENPDKVKEWAKSLSTIPA